MVTNLQDFPTHSVVCTAPDPKLLPDGLEPSDTLGIPLFALASSVRSRFKPERC